MSENGGDRQSEDGAAISDLSVLDEVLLTSSTLRTSADRAQELGNETPTVQDYGHEAPPDPETDADSTGDREDGRG